jgi:hypothetical protein
MTKEEIVQALRACGEMDCSPCKYRLRKEPFCVDALIRDAADLIEAQAPEISYETAVAVIAAAGKDKLREVLEKMEETT